MSDAPASDVTVQVVWFKRDLRLADHVPLAVAAEQGPVLPLYVVEPGLWAQPDRSRRHAAFLRGCLEELDTSLQAAGGGLWTRRGDMLDVLAELKRRFPRLRLLAHEETGTQWTYSRDLAVADWCRANAVEYHEFPQFGVIRGLKDRNGWAKRWEAFMSRDVVPEPTSAAWLAPAGGWRLSDLPPIDAPADPGAFSSSDVPPGREAGLHTLRTFLRRRGEHYQARMSSPLTAPEACSRLSPYIAWGCLSVREIVGLTRMRAGGLRHGLGNGRGQWQKSLNAFDGRLHWHCHFIQKLESQPSLEFRNLARYTEDLRDDDGDDELLAAWEAGQTGLPFVDACMRYLAATGWINFRMRAMLVSVSSYHLWQHWRKPALHLARLFTDYEPGIHYSQVQMQSGTTGINRLRIYNPVKQSREQDPDGAFIRRWVPELAGVPSEWIHEPWTMPARVAQASGVRAGRHYPAPVVDYAAAARAARARFRRIGVSADDRAERRAIHARHGSRRPSPDGRRRAAPPPRQEHFNPDEPEL